jgi:hypothetical protein
MAEQLRFKAYWVRRVWPHPASLTARPLASDPAAQAWATLNRSQRSPAEMILGACLEDEAKLITHEK